MIKKIGLIALIMVSISIVILFFTTSSKQESSSISKKPANIPISTESANSPSLRTKEYIDPSGFKFSYPGGLILDKKEITNNQIYSSIEISSPENPGKISIDVSSTNASTLKIPNSVKTKTLTLGDLNAQQYEDKSQIITLALDTGVLFTIKADYGTKRDFWLSVNEKITSSFAFVAPDNQSSTSSSSVPDDSIVDEGEEVIE